jgi:iron(III) transport system permease protein
MVLVEGFLWSPLAFLLVSATLRNANPELEKPARVHGAGVWRPIRRVTMRLSLPSIMALAMLVFIRAIEAFEVPALVGLPGRISVLTTDIYTNMVARAPPDLGGSSALSVLMLLLVLVLLTIYGRLSRHAERFATITGKGFRPRRSISGGCATVAAGILIFNFVLLLLVPMLMLVWVSLLPFFQPVSAAALKLVSLNNYRTVLESGPARADAHYAAGGGRDRDQSRRADLRRRLARGAARARAAGSSTGSRPIPLVFHRPHPRHRGDAALPRGADPDLRHDSASWSGRL